MIEIIKKIISNQQITLEEINTFVIEYCKLMENKQPTAQELAVIVQLIQMRHFDLIFACKIASIKLGYTLYSMHDKQGNLIKMYI
jgi:formyltetrahydrofolate hydrolase